MRRFSLIAIALLASEAVRPAHAQNVAGTCDAACRVERLERRAAQQGPGTHTFYDETTASARTYVVTREPKPEGGHRYDVTETTSGRNGHGFFDTTNDLFRSDGKPIAAFQIVLAARDDAGEQAGAKVFDLLKSSSPAPANRFGAWLGAYLKAAQIPVAAPAKPDDIVALQATQRGIRYGSALNRRQVRVVFVDGEARFALGAAEDRYDYVPGSARDLDDHRIPENIDELRAGGTYTFAGGATSSAFRGFANLVDAWMRYAPTDGELPDWQCIARDGGAVRCTLVN